MLDPRDLRLTEPHIHPLMTLVDGLRARGLNVPNFDPNDGGINAKALFLLESPGPRAVVSGYVSRDNPDPSARNLGKALDYAGFKRSDVTIWNVVPYCVSSIDQNRNASTQQIIASAPDTQAFINLMPQLRVIVFCGRRAAKAKPQLRLSPFAKSPTPVHKRTIKNIARMTSLQNFKWL
jgi:uracil-DNA glycosylase